MNAVLEAALAYSAFGWSVFPVSGKKAAVPWKQFQTERATEEQLREWFADGCSHGVAVALGAFSGVVRVDAEGSVPWDEYPLPATLQYSSPYSHGGWLYQHLANVDTHVYWKGSGPHEELRVQSDGAYCVLPPSPHPDGGFYQWTTDLPLALVPVWVRDRAVAAALDAMERDLRPTVRQPDQEELVLAFAYLPPADDYELWVRVGQACQYGDVHYGGDTCFKLWDAWSRKSASYKEGDCERKWGTFQRTAGRVRTLATVLQLAEQNSGGAFRRANRHEPISDLGFAAVLARVGEGRVKHSSEMGWYGWDGKRWSTHDGEKITVRIQHEVLELRYQAAVRSLMRHLQGDRNAANWDSVRKAKQATLAAIRHHECHSRIEGARAEAAAFLSLSCSCLNFDTHPFLLNCANGTLDLRTLELYPHCPDDMLSQLCPTPYDPEAFCPRWERFIEEVYGGRASLVRYVHKFLGYCLTGDVSEQMLLNMLGSGSNGKSLLLRVVHHVLGPDYAGVTPMDLLMAQRYRGHSTDYMTLYGKRFVWACETSNGQRWEEAVVKRLTGSDPITARFIAQDNITFTPTWKLAVGTNSAPAVVGSDEGIKRRIRIVPHDVRFWKPEDNPPPGAPLRDNKLDVTLFAEAPGILAWMVRGCQLWAQEGLGEPNEVRAATDSYFQDNDLVLQFIDSKCEREAGYRERCSKVRDAWAAFAGPHSGTAKSFTARLADHGVTQPPGDKNYYVGIKLRQ